MFLNLNLRFRVLKLLIVIASVTKSLLVFLVFFLVMKRAIPGNAIPRYASRKPAMKVSHQGGLSVAYWSAMLVLLGTMSTLARGDISTPSQFYTSYSADGRFKAFVSDATNLVPGDTNDDQVFVENLETGEIVRVSEDAAGEPGNRGSYAPSISADGRFVAFESDASNLVPGDSSNLDVFVKSVETGEIVRASEDAAGMPGNRGSGGSGDDTNNVGSKVSISADGRLVAFQSGATNLVPDDTNGRDDVFVKNVRTGEIVRASEDAAGIQGNFTSGSWGISISADGRFVAFTSRATNLILDDTDDTLRVIHVFIKNLETGEIVRVSEYAAGEPGNRDSYAPRLNADEVFVAFSSIATNIVLNDTNNSYDVFLADLAGVRTPTTPGNLRFSVYSRTAAEIFWDRSSGNGGVLYEVIRNGELIGVLDALSVFEDNLQPGADYNYLVTAIGNDGIRSTTSTVSFTTNNTEPSDNMNLLRPGNLRFVVYSRTAAELFWDRPVGQAYLYRVYFNGSLVGETDGVSWFSEDFTPGSVTTVEVVAVDSSGVGSAPSEVAIQTDAGGLSPVTGLRADVYSSTAAEIFWDRMPEPIHYRVYANGVEVAITDGTSWFSDKFEPGSTTEITVATFDRSNESVQQSVTVTTRGGISEEPPSGVPAVTQLRAAVYGEHFAEVFWDRPTDQAYSYRVFFNGVLEVETDGVSWWSRDFAPGSTTEVTVIAVDSQDAESPPTTVIVKTPGGDIGTRYVIGDRGPGGGTVFYVSNGGSNGLEAAPSDQDTMALWCSDSTDIEGVDNVDWFGPADSHSGAHNTPLIVAACGDNSAAGIAANYVWPNGQTDGFLPSKDELALLIGQQAVVGGFAQGDYWSSTESEISAAAVIITAPYLGSDSTWKDNTTVWVRAVRAF